MEDSMLEQAEKLINQGKPSEAQELLKRLIAADPHDLSAWFLFVETLPTIEQRIGSLKICLEYNPDSKPTQESITHLESSLGEDKIQTININSVPYSRADLYRPRPNPSWLIKLMFLLVTSTISALFLYAIEEPVMAHAPNSPFDVVLLMLLINGLQIVLIVLAVVGIHEIYFELFPQRPRHKFSYAVILGIPILFNLLGANSYTALRAKMYISDLFLYNSIKMTVIEQAILFDSSGRYYHAILHIQNNTGREIAPGENSKNWLFWIGSTNSKSSSWGIDQFGEDWVETTVPPGESDLLINIPIYQSKCDDSFLQSALFIQYQAPSATPYFVNSIQLNDDMAMRLKQNVCNIGN